MLLLLLIAGLVLLIAGSSWFTGAAAVGIVCIAVFGALFLLRVGIVAGALAAQRRIRRW